MNIQNKLAILIPTITGREVLLFRLLKILQPQVEKYKDNVRVIILPDTSMSDAMLLSFKDFGHLFNIFYISSEQEKLTIGTKRNKLEEKARELKYSHRMFIDDDDTVTEDCLDLNMPGVFGDYDCNSLVGILSINGKINEKKHIFIHSLKYDHWYEDDNYYYRNPNHLNVVKLECIKDIKFQDKNFGEDGNWSIDIHKAGCLKTEYEITKPFYNYLVVSKNKE